MPDETAFDAASLVTSAETAAGFWQMGILWTPLIPGESTRGAYSLMEQLMPAKAGPPPHVHDQGEEVFYILDGEMALQLGNQVVIGTSGQLVRIPAGTPHAFAVRTQTARVLNFYVPAALDLQVAMLGTPATSPILPPPGAQRPPTAEQEQAFTQRVHDLATQILECMGRVIGIPVRGFRWPCAWGTAALCGAAHGFQPHRSPPATHADGASSADEILGS